jgi:hypothetical protein
MWNYTSTVHTYLWHGQSKCRVNFTFFSLMCWQYKSTVTSASDLSLKDCCNAVEWCVYFNVILKYYPEFQLSIVRMITICSTWNLLLGWQGFWALISNNTPPVYARGVLMFHYVFALQFPTCFGLCLVIVWDTVLYTILGIAACLPYVLMIQNHNVLSRLYGKKKIFCNM